MDSKVVKTRQNSNTQDSSTKFHFLTQEMKLSFRSTEVYLGPKLELESQSLVVIKIVISGLVVHGKTFAETFLPHATKILPDLMRSDTEPSDRLLYDSSVLFSTSSDD